MKQRLGVIMFAGMFFAVTAVPVSAATIIETLNQNPEEFSALTAAVTEAGLADTLAATLPLTLFAPNNQAFAAMPPMVLSAITRDPALLSEIVKYHVANGRLSSNELSDGRKVPTLQGESLNVRVSRDFMKIVVNKSNVTSADNSADNGIFHVVDAVLIPHPVYVEIIKDLQGKVKKIAQLLHAQPALVTPVEAETTASVE